MAGRMPFLERVEMRLPVSDEQIWTLIRELDEAGPWTAHDVTQRTAPGVNPGTPRMLIRKLIAGGVVERVGERITRGKNPQPAPVYKLTRSPFELPRYRLDGTELPELGIETMWRTMKMLRSFTLAELADNCGRDGEPASRTRVGEYIQELVRVGILRVVGTEKPPGRRSVRRYIILKNVGARAPKILSGKIVFDPNARIVVGEVIASEVAS